MARRLSVLLLVASLAFSPVAALPSSFPPEISSSSSLSLAGLMPLPEVLFPLSGLLSDTLFRRAGVFAESGVSWSESYGVLQGDALLLSQMLSWALCEVGYTEDLDERRTERAEALMMQQSFVDSRGRLVFLDLLTLPLNPPGDVSSHWVLLRLSGEAPFHFLS